MGEYKPEYPEGYVRKEMKVPGGKVIIYRNPNPDPEEQRQALEEIHRILMIGYRRAQRRKAEEEKAMQAQQAGS